ncbi:MAG: hypothetical protein UT13_C0001G0364 [Candidatus Pacebacteria bacterium GW2011_GWF2_38_9]|nr:MAG: hypothetical protein US01_C0001G0373 [candidate division TM6 bacterium GW2011_GWF2_28_16]KKQ08475.1 MAG: hypothetical protein US20_C0016G0020 [Candidatus Pacebacteria bacterium GW2011_GWF1_36_5]KKQ88717.1 MAG: hypothetical protein UT13_C0001G0364 [Candidatus Pacebacteria bacterium GW2011_GWF2_38_9]HAZ73750.1 hypothetical protein [Candidatus Paceibacterota bacterium]
MSLASIESAQEGDQGESTALNNLKENPVARTEAEMALKAAHQALMGERAVTRDENENAVEAAADEENK